MEGEGWIFTGEKYGNRSILFENRKVEDGNTLFDFKIIRPDKFFLTFQLQERDGSAEYKIVKLQKEDAPALSEKTFEDEEVLQKAPDQETSFVGSCKEGEEMQGSGSDDKIEGSGSDITEITNGEELLKCAEEAEEKGDIAKAAELYEKFILSYPEHEDIDRIYFALGRLYEADSPARDMNRSYFCYKYLTDNFHFSEYWDRANMRMRFLERYYLKIR